MSEERKIGRVEDYTTPTLVMAGIILFMVLMMIKVLYGFSVALLLAWGLDRLIARGRTRINP